MIKYYSINGQVVPRDQALLTVDDIAILRGYGLFDFFLVKRGRPLFIEDHLDRFYQSAAIMHLKVPMERTELLAAVHELIRSNGMLDASIRIVLTGGISPDGFGPGEPNLLILQHESPNYPPFEYENGIKLMLHQYMRPFPKAKSTDYAMSIQLWPKTQSVGAKGVLFHWNGTIYEMARANFYIVTQDGTIVTTADDILHGVTRRKVLEFAKQNFKVEERNMGLEELRTAKEAFMTNTTRRLMSVVKIDDLTICDGRPGEVAPFLRELLLQAEREYLGAAAK